MFMVPQYIKDFWIRIDGTYGVEYYPASTFTASDSLEMYPGEAEEIEKIKGIGARLSAPGYLDCTPWVVFETHNEAMEHIRDTYNVHAITGEDLD